MPRKSGGRRVLENLTAKRKIKKKKGGPYRTSCLQQVSLILSVVDNKYDGEEQLIT